MMRARGFTLVELLLVLIILAAVAASATAMLDGVDQQPRYDITRDRLEAIRRAILGPDDAPGTQGFAADTGRLPFTLRELLRAPDNTVLPEDAPEATLRTYSVVDGVGSGWRGPYLLRTNLSGTHPEFPDGWANSPLPSPHRPHCFGWSWQGPTDGSTLDQPLVMTSRGSDGQLGSSPDLPFTVDVARTIEQRDWQVDIGGQSIGINLANSTSQPLEAVLIAPSPTNPSGFIEVPGVLSGTASGPQSVTFGSGPGLWVPAGPRALKVRVTAAPNNNTVVHFLLRPRGSLPPTLDRTFVVKP
jgi:prepilin-type N-terminal cleavage/methylation domain-containing protein